MCLGWTCNTNSYSTTTTTWWVVQNILNIVLWQKGHGNFFLMTIKMRRKKLIRVKSLWSGEHYNSSQLNGKKLHYYHWKHAFLKGRETMWMFVYSAWSILIFIYQCSHICLMFIDIKNNILHHYMLPQFIYLSSRGCFFWPLF